jgi:probable HAF family extracellular repeat protein
MLQRLWALLAAGSALLAAAAPLQAGQQRHGLSRRVIWLSSNLASTATGDNDRGQIAGRAGNQAVIWEHGSAVRLGTDGWALSAATAINDSGEVVGTLQTGARLDGFLWRSGKMTALGTHDGDAIGINDAGEIIGWTFRATPH